ncbi:hypothetical protein BCV72DRAFT_77486 [Rhizopus microsporus var. microsporus]|uniref:Uncharacterized protein n=1 Tax=Rhizopus microsporus var. microsporus TaxID=86635 RepID=A0A1X0RIG2_RHIZD|nr:hypothetical protein BCV72DRAFT_77486 [Rhizopus microsporus var. microsporus]
MGRGKYIHLWSLQMLTEDVQILEHLYHTEIPRSTSDIEKMLDLGNFVWKLAECMKKNLHSYNQNEERAQGLPCFSSIESKSP